MSYVHEKTPTSVDFSDSSQSNNAQKSKRFSFDISAWSEVSSSGYVSGYNTIKTKPSICNSRIQDEDDSCSTTSSDDSDWDEEEWPSTLPLPLPIWGCERPELVFSSEMDYLAFTELVKIHLQDNISTLPYDTLSTFIQFAMEYEKERSEFYTMAELFRDYDLPVFSGRNTCVGLSSNLLTRLSILEANYPGFKDSVFTVSCEEDIEDVDRYCASSLPPIYTCEKEHVLVCVRFKIDQRLGVMLLDPGYHCALPITVMEDGKFPHSEPYVDKNGETIRTNSYELHWSNKDYVIWNMVKESPGNITDVNNIILVSKPFLSGLDNAERRNLVYPVKTLINRERDGRIKSGFYIVIKKLENAKLTLFYERDNKQHKMNIPMKYFYRNPRHMNYRNQNKSQTLEEFYVPSLHERYLNGETDGNVQYNFEWENVLQIVAKNCDREGEMYAVLGYLAEIISNDEFINEMIDIEKFVIENSKDN